MKNKTGAADIFLKWVITIIIILSQQWPVFLAYVFKAGYYFLIGNKIEDILLLQFFETTFTFPFDE